MTIAAIPTMYNGLQFRSRLEARWAAMFDVCGFRYDYEPMDFNGYIPDFRIGEIFFEVKPTTVFSPEAALKMANALSIENGECAVLLQDSPTILPYLPFARKIGWRISSYGPDKERFSNHVLIVQVASPTQRYRIIAMRAALFADGTLDRVQFDDGSGIDRAWRDSCNVTQWLPRGRHQ